MNNIFTFIIGLVACLVSLSIIIGICAFVIPFAISYGLIGVGALILVVVASSIAYPVGEEIIDEYEAYRSRQDRTS